MNDVDTDVLPNKKKPAMPKDSLEIQAMYAALVSQHGEIETLKRKLKTERANLRHIKTQLALAERFNGFQASPIPADMLARLIRLCHPDRHNGSDAANAATAWLLEQRSGV